MGDFGKFSGVSGSLMPIVLAVPLTSGFSYENKVKYNIL